MESVLESLRRPSLCRLKCPKSQSDRKNDRVTRIGSHHQNQRFIIVIGPSDAPIRGSRSVPIEIMSKPRIDPEMQHARAEYVSRENLTSCACACTRKKREGVKRRRISRKALFFLFLVLCPRRKPHRRALFQT